MIFILIITVALGWYFWYRPYAAKKQQKYIERHYLPRGAVQEIFRQFVATAGIEILLDADDKVYEKFKAIAEATDKKLQDSGYSDVWRTRT